MHHLTWSRRPEFEPPNGRIPSRPSDKLRCPISLLSNGTCFLTWRWSSRGVKPDTHLHVVLSSERVALYLLTHHSQIYPASLQNFNAITTQYCITRHLVSRSFGFTVTILWKLYPVIKYCKTFSAAAATTTTSDTNMLEHAQPQFVTFFQSYSYALQLCRSAHRPPHVPVFSSCL